MTVNVTFWIGNGGGGEEKSRGDQGDFVPAVCPAQPAHLYRFFEVMKELSNRSHSGPRNAPICDISRRVFPSRSVT